VDIKTFYLFVNDRNRIIAAAHNDNQRNFHKIYSLKEWVKGRYVGSSDQVVYYQGHAKTTGNHAVS